MDFAAGRVKRRETFPNLRCFLTALGARAYQRLINQTYHNEMICQAFGQKMGTSIMRILINRKGGEEPRLFYFEKPLRKTTKY
jgi:hypothetical protein